MYALIFTNTVLGAYLLYMIAEKKAKVIRNVSFWIVLGLFLTSLGITCYTVAPDQSVEMVKGAMLP